MYQVILSAGSGVAVRLAPYAAQMAARFGIPNTVAGLINYARSNPVMFSLAAKEISDTGVSLYDWLTNNDPEAAHAVDKNLESTRNRLDGSVDQPDSISKDFLSKVSALDDELQAIETVVYALGSFDALQSLRRVMLMKDEHLAYYISRRIGTR